MVWLCILNTVSRRLKQGDVFLRQHLYEDAVLQAKQAETLHIALPRDLDLTNVFRVFYGPEAAKELGINQFLLSRSSFGDVFIALSD
jgi:hypothetical protein